MNVCFSQTPLVTKRLLALSENNQSEQEEESRSGEVAPLSTVYLKRHCSVLLSESHDAFFFLTFFSGSMILIIVVHAAFR